MRPCWCLARVGVLVEHVEHHPLELQVPRPSGHHGSRSWSEPSDGSGVVKAVHAIILLLPKPWTWRFRSLGCKCAGGSWGIPWHESGGGSHSRWCEWTPFWPGSFPRGGPSCRRRNHQLYSGATRCPDLQVLPKGLEEVVVATHEVLREPEHFPFAAAVLFGLLLALGCGLRTGK